MDQEEEDGQGGGIGGQDLVERSDDYKDGIPFDSKRKNHYDMKNALKLGRQMIEDDEQCDDDEEEEIGVNNY